MNNLFRCIFILVLISNLFGQVTIDVAVKGISDNKNDGEQKDRLEATMDAKRQALEKSGLNLKSISQVENFQTTYDYIETQAESVLLPGFQVIDNGYGADGSYSVVLVGKVRSVVKEDITFKELRYAEHLYKKGDIEKGDEIVNKLMYDANSELAEQANYLFVKHLFEEINFKDMKSDELDKALPENLKVLDAEYDKFKIYYPNNKYLSSLDAKRKNVIFDVLYENTGLLECEIIDGLKYKSKYTDSFTDANNDSIKFSINLNGKIDIEHKDHPDYLDYYSFNNNFGLYLNGKLVDQINKESNLRHYFNESRYDIMKKISMSKIVYENYVILIDIEKIEWDQLLNAEITKLFKKGRVMNYTTHHKNKAVGKKIPIQIRIKIIQIKI
ncbi:MAG: hypothetical protein PF638_11540 [Candidatus Delongbacteria bacterium]|jgi:hypothetical protein|nr:hypothetical protein [Candidatus Delongbacteria bacterium]